MLLSGFICKRSSEFSLVSQSTCRYSIYISNLVHVTKMMSDSIEDVLIFLLNYFCVFILVLGQGPRKKILLAIRGKE